MKNILQEKRLNTDTDLLRIIQYFPVGKLQKKLLTTLPNLFQLKPIDKFIITDQTPNGLIHMKIFTSNWDCQ